MQFVGMGCGELLLLKVLEQQGGGFPSLPSLCGPSIPSLGVPSLPSLMSPWMHRPLSPQHLTNSPQSNHPKKIILLSSSNCPFFWLCFPPSGMGCSFPCPCSVPACTALTPLEKFTAVLSFPFNLCLPSLIA